MKNASKYFFVLLITGGIFFTAWYLSNYFNNKKIVEIKDIQNQLAVDILSSETQYALLEQLSCTDINNSLLSQEIASLADHINYAEKNVGADNEVTLLKKQYTILEVKDFLLSKKIAERCGKKVVTILYFYGNKDNCPDCVKEGYVLDAIRTQYPEVRVYSFDYDLDLSTIRAMKSIYKVGDTLPAIVINGKTVSGFKSVEDIISLLPREITNSSKQAQKENTTKSPNINTSQ